MDDLMSLDWGKSSKPSSTSQPPSSSSQQPNRSNASSYSFDVLSKNLAAGPGSRPNYNSRPTPAPSQPAPSAAAKSTANGDAFSSLFASSSGTSSAAAQQGMTLAERQKLAASKASQGGAGSASGSGLGGWSSDADWGLLDSAGSGNKPAQASKPLAAPPSKPQSAAGKSTDPFDFDDFAQPQPAASRAPPPETTKPVPTSKAPAPSKAGPIDPFDFSEFEDPGVSQSSALGAATRSTAAATEDDDDPFAAFNAPPKPRPSQPQRQGRAAASDALDWSDADGIETGMGGIRLGDDDEEESSGLTGSGRRPKAREASDGVDDFASAPLRHPAQTSSRSKARGASSGPDPPPHILGKVVEMGFGLAEGKEALLSTRDAVGNLDVNAALERLVGGSGRGERGTPQGGRSREDDMEERDRKLAMRLQRQEQEAGRSRRGDASGQNSGRGTPRRQQDEDGAATPEWQRQAEDLVSQASEIGASVLTRAGAFWSQAKAQAQKALEERTGGDSRNGSGRNSPASGEGAAPRARPSRWAVPGRDNAAKKEQWNGKPRWMVDAENAESAGGDSSSDAPVTPFADSASSAPNSAAAATVTSGFKDSDDEGESGGGIQQQQRAGQKTSSSFSAAGAAQRNLWDEPAGSRGAPPSDRLAAPRAGGAGSGYVSPARRGTPVSRPAATSPTPAAAPIVKIQRQHPSEDTSSISRSNAAKEAGNAHFSKGAYGDAETQYGIGLQSLDPGSLLRVPLLNNRAMARLRNGDANGAVEDCEHALRLILGDVGGRGTIKSVYRPEAEGELPAAYCNVDLRGGFAKALSRKAQALEMGEKWERARFDWSLLESYEKQVGSGGKGGGTMVNLKAAREGMGRCDLAMRGGGGATSTTPATTTTAAKTTTTARNGGGATRPKEMPRQSAAAKAAIESAAKAGVDRVRAEAAALEAEESERLALKDSVDARIAAWKGGKENNLRALLASVEMVAWEGLGWKKVGMHQLVSDKQVKIAYTKAIAKLHPDKLTPKTTTVEERMVGTAVFSTLNDAWTAQQGG